MFALLLKMSSVAIFYSILALMIPVLITRWFQRHLQHSECQCSVQDQVDTYRRIADFSFFKATTLEDRLKLRAKPNARLVVAFGLDNSFTTIDKHVHQLFLKKAHDAVRLTDSADRWIELAADATTILGLSVAHFEGEFPYLPLASMIRIVSLSIVLRVLFGVEPSAIDLVAATKATDAINCLWVQSKDTNTIPSLYEQRVLENALKQLLPDVAQDEDGTSPLNLIMPAYETLWRVVLLTFVSVTSHTMDDDTATELREAIASVPSCFYEDMDAERRALAIAKEGLRLYPPTKRIYRAKSIHDEEEAVAFADVEACHRDSHIWGTDSLQYRPSRFHDWPGEDAQANSSYFPFGVGKHICPAAAGFGDRIITLLVAELTRYFGTQEVGFKIHFGDMNFKQQASAPLPSGRSDMEDWVLEVISDH
ncbi:hypothetical protein F4808DRAFT_28967 [Astrocystis sublimbata]|nr:hypothetical protein F4808DRAFT_28967 [Astrocystis sublimbata]